MVYNAHGDFLYPLYIYDAYCVVYDVWCAVCCMVYGVWCTVYSVQCTVYIVWCVIYGGLIYNVGYTWRIWVPTAHIIL